MSYHNIILYHGDTGYICTAAFGKYNLSPKLTWGGRKNIFQSPAMKEPWISKQIKFPVTEKGQARNSADCENKNKENEESNATRDGLLPTPSSFPMVSRSCNFLLDKSQVQGVSICCILIKVLITFKILEPEFLLFLYYNSSKHKRRPSIGV